MAEFSVTSHLTESTAVAVLAGDLDGASFDLLEDAFNRIFESAATGVILDCSDLESLSSSGLGAIINLSRLLGAKGGRLVLAGLRPNIRSILDLLGLREAVALAASRKEAEAMIAAAGTPGATEG